MSEAKNPYTKGSIPYNIWQSGYLEGKLEVWTKVTKDLSLRREERKKEFQNQIELETAKWHKRIM